jgi:glycine/sarcosine N-methyltransferase
MREQDFYDRLADFFDVMTDWHGRLAYEMPFITRLAGPAPLRVLDTACGTGWHSIALARAGYDTTGVDISPAMIERARTNAKGAGSAVSFSVASFPDLPATVGSDFDVVLCLGNSLVHVIDESQLLASLAAMASCLRPGGLLLLHNLNYDRRVVEKPRWFQVSSGLLDGKETLVWRFADYSDALITFNIAVFQKDERGQWTVHVQGTPQRPWQSHDLVRALSRCGFASMSMYGNLAGEPYSAQSSGDLVLSARRV